MSCVICQVSRGTKCAARCLCWIQMMMQRARYIDYQASFATKATIFLMICLSTGYSYVCLLLNSFYLFSQVVFKLSLALPAKTTENFYSLYCLCCLSVSLKTGSKSLQPHYRPRRSCNLNPQLASPPPKQDAHWCCYWTIHVTCFLWFIGCLHK